MERIDHLEETLAEIKEIDTAKGRSIMENYDSFIEEFQLTVKIKLVRVSLNKASEFYVEQQELMEKAWLFNAYCKIKENSISNENLRTATLVDYTTGNILTLSGIEQRLTALGWQG